MRHKITKYLLFGQKEYVVGVSDQYLFISCFLDCVNLIGAVRFRSEQFQRCQQANTVVSVVQ